ncbi:MAG: hypothetical protein WD512_02325 [Candidatus Paceibacterota bacterium]
MKTIYLKYALKWRFKNYPFIQITECKKVINTKTNKLKKQCYNSGSIGYWIGKQFFTKQNLNKNIELIPCNELIPF